MSGRPVGSDRDANLAAINHDGPPEYEPMESDTLYRPLPQAANRRRSWGARTWVLLCRVIVAAAVATSSVGAVVSFRDGHLLNGALCVGFGFMQPMLYRAMTYGL